MSGEENRRAPDPEWTALREMVGAMARDLGDKLGAISTNVAVLAATTTLQVAQLKEEQTRHHNDDDKRFEKTEGDINSLKGVANRTKGALWAGGAIGGGAITAVIEGAKYLTAHGN